MKLSDILEQYNDSGDFGLALNGLAEKARELEGDLAYSIEQAQGWYDDCYGGELVDERMDKYKSILEIKSPN